MHDEVAIRQAQPTDWPAIEALLVTASLPTAGAKEHLQAFVVAVRGARTVGAAGVEIYGCTGLLRSVVVAPEAQDAGVGRQLVAALIAYAGRHDLQRIYLLTTTAATYFEALGFEEVERRLAPGELAASEEFRGACPASAALMLRTLV